MSNSKPGTVKISRKWVPRKQHFELHKNGSLKFRGDYALSDGSPVGSHRYYYEANLSSETLEYARIQISSGHLYLPGEIGYNKLENKSWLYHFLESGFNFYVKKPSKYIPIGEIEKVKDYGR